MDIFNIANESEVQIIELANKIKAITNSKSEIISIQSPNKRYDFEVERRSGCCDKLFKITNYKPATSIDEGLKKTYAFLNQT